MKLESWFTNIYNKDGIWYSHNRDDKDISYPDDGNMKCYQIEDKSFWFNHRNNCIIKLVKKYSKDDVFFDVGGGNGFVAKGLQNNGINSVLIEPGIEGAINAKNRGLDNVVCSTLQDVDIKPEMIKAIGVFDVVEHIEDADNFIKILYDSLGENGYLYVTVPAYKMLWSLEDDDAGHYKRYTLKTLSKLLEKNGFKMKYRTYIFSILPIPVFLFRTLPSIFKIYKKKENQTQSDHTVEKGFFQKILSKIWNKELKMIEKQKKIPFGGSCLVVAQKKS